MGNINNLYIPVRERIFTLLKSKKIPQNGFAQAIGVHATTISDWKKGKSFSFMKKLPAIAEALNTTEVWLLTGRNTAQGPGTVEELEKIAAAEGTHVLDLIGTGKYLAQYRTDVTFPEDTPPEVREQICAELSQGPRIAYEKIDYKDKAKLLDMLSLRTLLRNIRRYCGQRGVTPEDACRESGAGEDFLDDIMRVDGPPVDGLQKLAHYLNVSSAELRGEQEPTIQDILEVAMLSKGKVVFAAFTEDDPPEYREAVQRFVAVNPDCARIEGKGKPTPVAGDGLTPEFIQLYEKLGEAERAFVIKQMRGLLSQE